MSEEKSQQLETLLGELGVLPNMDQLWRRKESQVFINPGFQKCAGANCLAIKDLSGGMYLTTSKPLPSPQK